MTNEIIGDGTGSVSAGVAVLDARRHAMARSRNSRHHAVVARLGADKTNVTR